MGYFLILILIASSYVDSISSATEPSRHKRDDESEPWKNPVLPNTIEPIRYDIYLSPRHYNNDTEFFGNVSIEVNVLTQTKFLIVHVKDLTLGDRRIRAMDGTEIDSEDRFPWPENDYYVMQAREFVQGKVKLTFSFSGNMTLVKDSYYIYQRSALYSFPYANDDGSESWLVLSDLGHGKARRLFPCFDDPRFKANFRLKIEHWRSYTALSNMPMEMYEQQDESAHVTVFKLSPKMNSHQFAFALTEFSFKNTTVDGKQLFVWGRPGRIENANYTLAMTPAIQKYLSEELGVANSLEKLDQIAVPWHLSVPIRDNWGLNIFMESRLLHDQATEGDYGRIEVLKRIAHTQAHYYFGNLVTCRNWNHFWLDEGLATFYELRSLVKLDQTVMHNDFFFGEKTEKAMSLDFENVLPPSILTDGNVVYERSENDRTNKGVAILRMVENFVGAEAFKRGITRYLTSNANATVVTDDLWNALQQEVVDGVNIATVMKNWVQTKGFPSIKVELLPGNKINATQRHFCQASRPSSQERKWYVPLTYKIKGGDPQMIWMNETDVSVVFDIPELPGDDWIEFNVDRTGYYRVNYDEGLWDRIVKQLNADHTVFSELSRSKLISDARALVRSEELGYDVLLKLTKYASKEEALTPWLQISKSLIETNKIHNTSFSHLYKNYVLNLTKNMMDKLQVRDEGTYLERQLRPVIMTLSCSAGYQGCVDNVIRMFQAWIQDETANAVPENFRDLVYCAGVALSSDVSEWNTVLERYLLLPRTAIEEGELLLRGLCCTRNTDLLERLLDHTQNSTEPESMAFRLLTIYFIAINPYSEDYAWNWIRRKFAEVKERQSEFYAGLALGFIVNYLNTRTHYQEALDFFNGNTNISDYTRNQTLGKINSNIHWLDRNFGPITTWFEANA